MFDFLRRKKKSPQENRAKEDREKHQGDQPVVEESEIDEAQLDQKNEKLSEVEKRAEITVEAKAEVEIEAAVENNNGAKIEDKVEKRVETNSEDKPKKRRFFRRLTQGLRKTRSHFTEGLGNLFLGKKVIDTELLTEIEDQLLLADIGVEACQQIIDDLTQRISRKQVANPEALFDALKSDLRAILEPCEIPMIDNDAYKDAGEVNHQPYVILMVGVNGVGKTTTIGKLAKRFQTEGKKVMLAAGDTFRAAAIEQLQVWGERNQIAVIAQQHGADSASVAYDAFEAAKARKIDILIIDTAGRLHTQNNLMRELEKVKRVIGKLDEKAPHEIMLVLDAGNGQNALSQAKQFHKSVNISGITLTKLDGTAKGGIIFAIAKSLNLPIRFIGVGEGIDDLRPFVANDFVDALFERDDVRANNANEEEK